MTQKLFEYRKNNYRMRKKRFIITITNYYFNNLETKYQDVLKNQF